MGTLTLTLPDGRSGTLNVDDGFASMSDAAKADFIGHVKDQLAPHQSFSADLTGGLHDLGTAVSQGANALGFEGAGKAIQGITPDAPPGPSAGEMLSNNLRTGNYGEALGNLPHAIARALPSTGPILAGALAGGPVAAGAIAGGLAFGPGAYARAANNNRTEPNLSDKIMGGVNAIPQAIGGALLPGGLSAGIANPLLRAGARAALAAESGAGMNAANQVGTTVGTAKGLTVDPYEVAGAGLTQGGLGGAIEARRLAGEGVKAGADQLMARTMPTPDAPTAQSIVRVTDAVKGVQDQRAASGQPVTAPAAFAAVKDGYLDNLNRAARGLRDANTIDKTDFYQLNNTIDAAKVGKNTVTKTQLDHIDGLGLPLATANFLKENLLDLNTASTQSFLKNETGPFAKAGSVLGKVAGVGAGLISHDPAAILATVLGTKAEGAIGAKLGSMADRAMGTNTPPLLLQRINALKALKAAGIDPSSLSPAQMPQPAQAAPQMPPMGGLQGPTNLRPSPSPMMAAPDPVTGNRPDAVPVNTPISAGVPVPTGGANLPPLRINTPADVRSTLATDDMAARAPQTAPQPGPPTPAPPLPGAPQAAPTAPLTGAMAYIAKGLPHLTPEQIVQGLRDQEAVGILQPGEVDRLLQAPSVPGQIGKGYQELLARAMAKRAVGNQGYAVENSEQARVNARGYQTSMDQAAAQNPQFGNLIRAIKMEKTVAGKKALAQAAVAADPAAAQVIQSWMLEQGQR